MEILTGILNSLPAEALDLIAIGLCIVIYRLLHPRIARLESVASPELMKERIEKIDKAHSVAADNARRLDKLEVEVRGGFERNEDQHNAISAQVTSLECRVGRVQTTVESGLRDVNKTLLDMLENAKRNGSGKAP